MAPIVELFIRWIHFIAAIVWFGGIFFSVSVATPILRKHFQILESVEHTTAIRNRLRHIIRFTIHILLITGAMNLFIVGLNTQMRFSQDYSYFVVFIVKLAFVGLMTLFHSLHIAVFNRRLESADSKPQFRRFSGCQATKESRPIRNFYNTRRACCLCMFFVSSPNARGWVV